MSSSSSTSVEGRCRSSFVLPDLGQVGNSSRSVSCLHFDLLDLRSRSSMFGFVRAKGDFFILWITMHPTRPQWCHAFTSLRHDLISATTPTHRSGGLRDMSTPGSSPTRVSAVPDRQARPSRRPADLSVGPPRPDMWAQVHEDSLVYKTR
jgi:hypothetical protein